MLLTLDAVRKTHGTTTLLDGISLGIDDTERIGVVGRNGAGKSTLLRIVGEREAPDDGRVAARAGLRVGMLDQTDTLPAGTIGHIVLGDRIEHEWAGSAATRSVLDGLEIRGRLDEDVAHLSGGERRRVALARLLVTDALEGLDLLILDEPTNHLDVEGVAWLADFLKRRRRALLVVTHDRWFLDEVCEMTWEVAGGRVNAYEGGYAAYVLAKAERERVAAATEARRSNLLRKELAWLRRGPPARTSKPQFRIDAANALIADEPPPRESMTLLRAASARLGKSVYDVEDVSLAFGERRLLEHITWRVGPGDRLAVVGVNGAGKSTLLRLLAGEAEPSDGRVDVGQTVRPAYLSQQVAELDPKLRVLEAVEEVGRYLAVETKGTRELTAGQLLESFGFAAAKQWTRVGDLSGGERRRLQILRLLLGGANVLLLDEPTNDLDIETLQALEDVLDGWPGTLIVVSHDRYFVERVADTTLALLGDGSLQPMVGGIDEYLQRRATSGGPAGGQTKGQSGGVTPSAPAAARTGDTRAEERARAKELTKLERAIERLDKREAKLHAQLAEAAADHAKVLELDAELRGVLAEKAAAEDAWLELADS